MYIYRQELLPVIVGILPLPHPSHPISLGREPPGEWPQAPDGPGARYGPVGFDYPPGEGREDLPVWAFGSGSDGLGHFPSN